MRRLTKMMGLLVGLACAAFGGPAAAARIDPAAFGYEIGVSKTYEATLVEDVVFASVVENSAIPLFIINGIVPVIPAPLVAGDFTVDLMDPFFGAPGLGLGIEYASDDGAGFDLIFAPLASPTTAYLANVFAGPVIILPGEEEPAILPPATVQISTLVPIAPIPLPGAGLMLLGGLGALAGCRRLRRHRTG